MVLISLLIIIINAFEYSNIIIIAGLKMSFMVNEKSHSAKI